MQDPIDIVQLNFAKTTIGDGGNDLKTVYSFDLTEDQYPMTTLVILKENEEDPYVVNDIRNLKIIMIGEWEALTFENKFKKL